MNNLSSHDRLTTSAVGHIFRTVTSVIVLLLAACGVSDNPQLDMCQTITRNLAGEIAAWPNTETKESGKLLIVSGNYKLTSGSTGDVRCVYQRQNTGNDADGGPFKTAPQQVTINGKKIGTKELLTASLKATSEQLGIISKETARQGKQLADDTTRKAEELTDQAETAIKKVEEQVGEAAASISKKAQQVSEEAADEVKKVLK